MLNGKKLDAFPVRQGARQGGPLLLLLFNILWKSYAVRQVKEITGTQIWKEEIKLCSQIA